MRSKVHFLAAPLDFFGPQYEVIYPVEDRIELPEHSLFVGVNGPEEAAAMRRRFGVTTAENLQRLEKTGVLVMPKKK